MTSKEIVEGRDYAYTAYPRRNHDIYSTRASRVRVLKKGQARNLKDRYGYDLGQQAARKDGVEIRFYAKDANNNDVLSERTATVTARNLLTDWPDYAAKQEAKRQREQAERRRAEREKQQRAAVNATITERLAVLGIEARKYGWSDDAREWRITGEELAKLLERVPVQPNVPQEIDYAEVA